MRNLIFILLVLIPVGCFAQGDWTARQDFLSGAQIGDDAGASGIATIDSMVFTGANSGVWSNAVKYNFLEGVLNSPTTITGSNICHFRMEFSDASDRSAVFRFNSVDGLSMVGWSNDDYSGNRSILAVDSNIVTMAQYDGAAIKSIMMDTAGMYLRDDDEGRGLTFFADYSASAEELDITPKIYQDLHLGGQNLNSTVYSPGDDEHGDLIVWDTATSTYISQNVVPVSEASGIMIVAVDTILFSNTTVDTIVILPVGAVIWDIQVYVETEFDGSGTNLLDVGIVTDAARYKDDLDVEVTAPVFIGLANLPDYILGTSYVVFQYFDSGADASAGEAYIYVHYSIQ